MKMGLLSSSQSCAKPAFSNAFELAWCLDVGLFARLRRGDNVGRRWNLMSAQTLESFRLGKASFHAPGNTTISSGINEANSDRVL
jgi:hypothetical protein